VENGFLLQSTEEVTRQSRLLFGILALVLVLVNGPGAVQEAGSLLHAADIWMHPSHIKTIHAGDSGAGIASF